ncbi:hydroxymethylglutaryl-CoA lyase [Heliobacterium gestii]|uniref:Hydroxymethylglutaryl-CoA lyase n=1 Tax=Heliomicrobium gestii TaxID=2699 RepID=A0A845LBQ1_HELGE|nr:hydroxymethylglutaryl-CoA lyase [Heliomicrobium gestii]MBM7867699.1 hydroxymethylglutaryl-CoA lyase [Heliomicrobium gestii]MZP44092.1 hydroxymethylglutaryl-CoA lyase [Heliomicrobium gestii]
MTMDVTDKKVVIGECWARDGLQHEAAIIATADKVRILNRIQQIGFTRVEATSFAHPRYLPQFNDAEVVLQAIERHPGVRFRAIVTTDRAMARAAAAREAGYGVDEIAMVLASTDAYNRHNVKMDRLENMGRLESLARQAIDSGHDVIGWILTAFGCPFTGDVPFEEVARLARWWKECGASQIGLGDTTGMANPRQVANLLDHLRGQGFSETDLILHFHDTRGTGVANNLMALLKGFVYLDSSLGAMGGQARTGAPPSQAGHGGNTCTEDLVAMLQEMGVDTAIDLAGLCDLGVEVEEVMGRRLRANVLCCGPVRHSPQTVGAGFSNHAAASDRASERVTEE